MPLRITIEAFSGRPNPSVTIDGPEEEELVARLKPDKRVARGAPEHPEWVLGYRGIYFEQVGRKRRDLPRRFRLAGGLMTGPKLRHAPVDAMVEDFICGSTGPMRLGQFEPQLLDGIREQLHDLTRIDLSNLKPGRWPVRESCACAPLYEPDWWNDGGNRQAHNNCYNYGTNYRTDTFAQPGRASGNQYSWPIACAGVKAGAVSDDLIDSPKADPKKCPKEGHLVALVVAPGPGFNDFHWYRRGRNGLWSHKPGGGQATNLDNSGHYISDPRNADRGAYTNFCTFMTVMHGHTKIN
jgi:hypothetical protein